MSMSIDTFLADYTVEKAAGLINRSDLPTVEVSTASRTGSSVLRVSAAEFAITRADMEPYLLAVEAGDQGLDGVFSAPRLDTVCIVAHGQGYWVPTKNPNRYEVIDSYPILEVYSITEFGIIIFVDFAGITAYGRAGAAWKTGRISWDGIRISQIDSGVIQGLAWDAPKGKDVAFSIEVQGGKVMGGADLGS